MSSRIATVTLLAVALLMLSSGAAFATSALSTDTNASAAQYGTGAQNAQQTLGAIDQGSVAPVRSAGNGQGPDVAAAATAQAPRQLAAGSGSEKSSLPFTGLALIPILLLGVVLLTLGLVLRRRGANAAPSI